MSAEPSQLWRDVPGFVGMYQVSNGGIVRRLSGVDSMGRQCRGRDLKAWASTPGYLQVTLHNGSDRRVVGVHILVAEAFLPPRPTGAHQVNHRNRSKTDNRVENLEWVTRSENIIHSIRTGSRRATLTPMGVRVIRRLIESGAVRTGKIAEMFGVTPCRIRQIARGRGWRHVA